MVSMSHANVDKIYDWIKDYFLENGPDAKAVIGISGGKDSTVCATLLCRALGPENVITVIMPNGVQHDFDVACEVVKFLNIPGENRYIINIKNICQSFYNELDLANIQLTDAVITNLPARVRMTILYAIAAYRHGRVCNTCNKSEDYVGYSTKFGDNAGDFALLKEYTVKEVRFLGSILGIPSKFIEKVPEDGLSGKTDEDNLGFTYDELDSLILENEYPEWSTYVKIEQKHKNSRHKEEQMPSAPHVIGYSVYRD